jgi:hypothetical protein
VYLNAIHDQLGPRLVFWVNTLLDGFNLESYAEEMKKDGRNPQAQAPNTSSVMPWGQCAN